MSASATQQKAAASRAFLESHYRGVIQQVASGERHVGPRERKMRLEDFQILKVIGRGAFGEVFIARKDNELFAIKSLRKADMLKRKQVFHVRSERNIMAAAAEGNPWVVQLLYSFEENEHLVMVMEYMPGGDLMTWLCNEEVFTADQTRFYIAELCMAVNAVHEMQYVHRDIKPDNVMLDANGHIKLTDFGLCKSFADASAAPEQPDLYAARETTSGDKRQAFLSVVGSPGYIAPEILQNLPYGAGCDWWSVGIIMYECLYGCPPFYSEDNQHTCYKITHWREYLHFPDASRTRYPVPDAAVHLIRRLLCDQGERAGFDEIRQHPFFDGIQWDRIRTTPAAFRPALRAATDTRYFPTIEARRGDGTKEQDTVLLEKEDPRGVLFAGFTFSIDTTRRQHVVADVAHPAERDV